MTNARGIPTARDAFGFPVPPTWAVKTASRVRDGLGRAHAKMSPGFGLVLERLFGLIDNKALYCAVELGIPDVLADGPLGAAEIAARVDADPNAVVRVLRYLESRDLFSVTPEGRYANNVATNVLCRDHPYSWRDWVMFFGSDWNWQIWNQMPVRVREGLQPSEAAYGTGFFDYINRQNPPAGEVFNGAMASGSRMQAILFAETIDLAHYESICDVGGGSGSVLAHILSAHPGLTGTVFDLRELGGDADRVLDASGVADRASFVGGDFFESVPPEHDLYTLFAIIHDWDDADCIRILGNVREAMRDGGRAMVVEIPVPSRPGNNFSKASDMIMLVHGDGGRERTLGEYKALFEESGLEIATRTVMPSLFEVFELKK